MISSIPPTDRRRGFTLVESMVGMTISVFLLVGVLSAFLLFIRSGIAVSNYAQMAANGRRAVDAFAADVRMASNQVWNSNTSVTLTVPVGYTASANRVTYYFDSTAGAFKRKAGDATSTNPATTLCRDVSTLSLSRYSRNNAAATSEADTKRLQLTMHLRTHTFASVDQTSLVVSASYVMRNNPSN
jgi:prepilin-type N-terminal cleavage/methylation domain-containing protein